MSFNLIHYKIVLPPEMIDQPAPDPTTINSQTLNEYSEMPKFSRLNRKQEKRNIKLAIFYGVLTLILGILAAVLGIPALIKLAVFLGDIRSSSSPIESRDSIPPSAPMFTTTLEATNSSQINIAGFAEPGSSVILSVNGTDQTSLLTDNEGLFKIDVILSEGENEITAVAKDNAGNQSPTSPLMNILFDNVAPKLDITYPEKEQSGTNKDKINVTGKTEPEVNLTINDHLVVIKSDGTFEYPFTLKEGENQIIINAKDISGNKVEKTFIVNYSE